MKVASAVVGFLVVKLSVLVLNVVRFPVLRSDSATANAATDADGEAATAVSVLVPVRDEAHRLPATLAGLLALLDAPAGGSPPGCVAEIVFCDDGSIDGSADLIRTAAGGDPRVRVISGAPRPAGWAGKTWACDQLARAARSDHLLFCDADVVLGTGVVAAAVAERERQGADLLSVFPRERTGSLGERLLVPLIDDVLLCLLPFPLLAAPVPSAATAHGAFLFTDRAAYDTIGGFAAVRDAVVEDVALARLTRRRGRRLGLALGGDLVSTRMYTGYRAAVVGIARGVGPVAGSRAALLLGWTWHVVAYTAPVVIAGRGSRGRSDRGNGPGATRLWRLALTLAVVERLLVEAKTGRRQWVEALTMPLSPVAAAPVVWRALRPEHEWKGRQYRW